MINIKLIPNIREIMSRLSGAYVHEIESQSRPVVHAALQALKAATPRDTGRAASSWFISESFGSRLLGKPSRRFILQNSVPYIEALNMGHSKQAPPRFIEKTLAKFGLLGGI